MGAVISCIQAALRTIGNAIMAVISGIGGILQAIISAIVNFCGIVISAVCTGEEDQMMRRRGKASVRRTSLAWTSEPAAVEALLPERSANGSSEERIAVVLEHGLGLVVEPPVAEGRYQVADRLALHAELGRQDVVAHRQHAGDDFHSPTVKETGKRRPELAHVDDDPGNRRRRRQPSSARDPRVDRPEQRLLSILALVCRRHHQRHRRPFADRLGEGVLLAPHGRKVALLLRRAAVVEKVDADVARRVRRPIHLHPPDEARVRFVHDDVARLDLFQHMFVLVALVRVHRNEILHVEQPEVIVHVLERVGCRRGPFVRLGLRHPHLGHERGHLARLLQVLRHRPVLSPYRYPRPGSSATDTASLIVSKLPTRVGARAHDQDRPVGVVSSGWFQIHVSVHLLQHLGQHAPFRELLEHGTQGLHVLAALRKLLGLGSVDPFPGGVEQRLGRVEEQPRRLRLARRARRRRVGRMDGVEMLQKRHGVVRQHVAEKRPQDAQVINNLTRLPTDAMPVGFQLLPHHDVKVAEKRIVEVPIVHVETAVSLLELVDADLDALEDGVLHVAYRVRHRHLELDHFGLLLALERASNGNLKARPKRCLADEQVSHRPGQRREARGQRLRVVRQGLEEADLVLLTVETDDEGLGRRGHDAVGV
ncbi:hypothetical protein CP533_6842 [Ophiocordyceps camponoti-saundersi (nom. inval.)]|nr:hypothetical protein CP533_6842 [Ophiocordyceps camponoti-saundersi (nom. inval.)]